jgi:hypothetical protein
MVVIVNSGTLVPGKAFHRRKKVTIAESMAPEM